MKPSVVGETKERGEFLRSLHEINPVLAGIDVKKRTDVAPRVKPAEVGEKDPAAIFLAC